MHDVFTLISKWKTSKVEAKAGRFVSPKASVETVLHLAHTMLLLHTRDCLFDAHVHSYDARFGTVEFRIAINKVHLIFMDRLAHDA